MKASKNFTTSIIHYVVYALLVIVIWHLPPTGSLTVIGMHTLGVFVAMLYGLIFIKQYAVTCFATMVLMSVTGYYGTMSECLVAAFSDTSFIMIFTVLMIAGALRYTGTISLIARKMLNAKFAAGRPWVLTALIMGVTFVLAVFNDSIVVVPIMLTLTQEIFKGANVKGGKWTLFLLTSILGISLVTSTTMPFCMIPAMVVGVMTSINPAYDPANYSGAFIATNFMISLTMTIMYFLVVRFVCRDDVEDIKNYVPDNKEYKFNFDQKVTLGVFIFYVVIQLIPYCCPAGSKIQTILNYPGVAGWAIIATALVSLVVKRDGNVVVPFEEIGNRLGWFAILMMAAIGTVLTPMQSDVTGILTWFGELITPIVSSLGGFACFAMLVIICIVFTNLADNIAVIFIAMPIVYVAANAAGLNPISTMVALIPAVNIGISLPASTPYTAMLYGLEDTGYVKKTKIMGVGFTYCLLGAISMIFWGWTLKGLFPTL